MLRYEDGDDLHRALEAENADNFGRQCVHQGGNVAQGLRQAEAEEARGTYITSFPLFFV